MRVCLARRAAICLAFAATAAIASDASPALLQSVRGFYGVYMTLHPSDGIPDKDIRARLAPYVTPALDKLFEDGEAADARFAQATKHMSPPLIEGDLFTPNFEGATAFSIEGCEAQGDRGRCQIRLTYDDRKDKPLVWTDTAELLHTPQGWRIDDIVYSAAFGTKGTLRGTLQNAIDEGVRFSGDSR